MFVNPFIIPSIKIIEIKHLVQCPRSSHFPSKGEAKHQKLGIVSYQTAASQQNINMRREEIPWQTSRCCLLESV